MFSNLKKCVSIRLLRAERLSFVFCFHRQRQHHHRQHRKPKVFRSSSSSKFTYGRKQKRYCKYLCTIEQSKISYPLFYFVLFLFISFFQKSKNFFRPDDFQTFLVGVWKRNLEWREFGGSFGFLRSSNTIIKVYRKREISCVIFLYYLSFFICRSKSNTWQ